MATQKQLAALKKARAAKKRNVDKRKVGTSQTKKSRATGKTPSKRLKKRRASNTKKGYYPNPTTAKKTVYLVKVETTLGEHGYLKSWPKSGPKFDTLVSNAYEYDKKSDAEMIANILASGVCKGVRRVGAVKKY